MHVVIRVIFVLTVFLSVLYDTAQAGLEDNYYTISPEEFFSYPIGSIKNNNIAIKKAENNFNTSSAIYILTREDIRRSGATSIPEALRLAPGVQVVRLDSSRYLVSIRGFNTSYTNKILVLVDGRSVYTPLFSGVYYDEIDYPLEDIDRIEIIRGPGATIWGSNAVNGVINIITKNAERTQKSSMNVTVGNSDKLITSFRRGMKIKDDVFFRSYAKFFTRDNTQELKSKASADDKWNKAQMGFRLDKNGQDTATIQGDIYKMNKNGIYKLPDLSPDLFIFPHDKQEVFGTNILSKWKKQLSDTSYFKLQLYANYVRRDHIVLNQEISTYDLEFFHFINSIPRNELVWGGGYRHIIYDLEGSKYVNFAYPDSSNGLVNIFIQDKLALIDQKLDLTIGSKFEYNEYTHFEHQPNARLSWNVTDNQTLWTSISKAVRIPGKAENDLFFTVSSNGSKYYKWVGRTGFKSEELLAYELGYRIKKLQNFFIDTTFFYNKYKNLRTLEQGDNFADTYLADYAFNYGSGDVYGGEISIDWQVNYDWQIIASYSHLKMMLTVEGFSNDSFLEAYEGKSPRHMYNIRSHYNLTNSIELDNVIYYMDQLPQVSTGVRSYIRFDTRIGYIMKNGDIKLSLVAQDLFDDSHWEGEGMVPGNISSAIGRKIYINLLVRY